MASGDERPRQGGYTYLMVLVLVATIGAVAAQAGVVWQHSAQREREAELIAIGLEFARALASYTAETPVGTPPWPTDLQNLVDDRRWPTPRRHLRRIYHDPMTGEASWGLAREGDAIVGVYSLSERTPIRRHDLPPELGDQAQHAARYADWVFRALPR